MKKAIPRGMAFLMGSNFHHPLPIIKPRPNGLSFIIGVIELNLYLMICVLMKSE